MQLFVHFVKSIVTLLDHIGRESIQARANVLDHTSEAAYDLTPPRFVPKQIAYA